MISARYNVAASASSTWIDGALGAGPVGTTGFGRPQVALVEAGTAMQHHDITITLSANNLTTIWDKDVLLFAISTSLTWCFSYRWYVAYA
jgi:hypothetical protein